MAWPGVVDRAYGRPVNKTGGNRKKSSEHGPLSRPKSGGAKPFQIALL